MEEGRVARFHERDFVISRITNHECVGIHEFTNKLSNFHELSNNISSFNESRTTTFSRIQEQSFLFSRIREPKKPIPACTNAALGGGVLSYSIVA